MKQKVIGFVREKAIESTAGFGPAGAIVKLMLANVLMQFMLIERKITHRKHRNKIRRAK